MNSNLNDNNKSEKCLISPFEMPEIWNNEDEIYNLMQTFKRPRHVDPVSYDFKINFWSSLILRYSKHNHVLVVNELQLQSLFEKVFKSSGLVIRPLCLGRVLSHMKNSGLLTTTDYFESKSMTRRMVGGIGWLIATPVKWSIGRVSSLFYVNDSAMQDETDNLVGDYVLVDLVSDTVRDFIKLIASDESCHVSPHIDAISLDNFNQMLSLYVPHHISRTFLQDYLSSNRLIEPVSLPDSTVVVKFSRSFEKPISIVGMTKNQQDQVMGLVKLNALKSKLESDESLMETKLNQMKSDVLRCLRSNKKDEAKIYHKRGKMIEQMLERKRKQMDNVEKMLIDIDTANDNMDIMNALSSAAGTLRAQAVDVDSVHDTMGELGDLIADQDEINASIGALGDKEAVDIADLEAELNKLLVDDYVPASLPIVPRDTPVPVSRPVAGYVRPAPTQ